MLNMNLKGLLSAASLAVAVTAGFAAPASATIVNISALDGSGTIVELGAGSYTINPIGIADGGAYNSWSPWGSDSGCDANGMNCGQGWTGGFAIDFGHGTDNFDRVDGLNYGHNAIPGNNYIFATDLQALASLQSDPLIAAPIPLATQQSAYFPVGSPVTFTLATAQEVNFFIFDSPYGDNRGGVSLSVTTSSALAPEPTTWGLLLMGFAGIGTAIRARRKKVAASA